MKGKISKLLYALSLSAILTIGCLSMKNSVLAVTDAMEETGAGSTESIEINKTHFPDAAFRKYVQTHIDQDENGVLDESEIAACLEIDCSGQNISDLTGIEIFTNLKNLDCSNNNLATLDISQNIALTQLYCYGNSLNEVDTSRNSNLGKIVLLNPPTVNDLTNEVTGVRISWSRSTGADGYYIYRRIGGNSWETIATLAGENTLSYIDKTASSGTTYEYTVGGYYNNGAETVLGNYDQNGKSIFYVAAPQITKLDASNQGIEIAWGGVTGAEKYRVYYKTGSGSWTRIAELTSTSYTWTGAKIGTTYAFTIRCVSGDGKSFTSSFDGTGKSIQYVATPQLAEVTNVNGGVTISWDNVTGADKYRVYYKTGSGTWIKAGDTTSTSYTWTGAQSGTSYTFTVRCINSSGNFTSGYDTKGKSIQYVAAPKVTSVTNENGGVKITWDKPAGSVKYRVYYKTGSGSWTRIAELTSNSYTWTGAKSGTTYAFAVRCVSSDSKSFTSGFDGVGKSIQYVAAPKLSEVTNINGGITISWEKVTGAEKYRVYYKTGSGSWTKIGDTTSTNYTWTGAKAATTYTFTVRCIDSKGNFTSGYDAKGKSIQYITAPKITSLTNEYGGVKITWEKPAGSVKYRVYYKTGSGSWTRIAETSANSYIWTGAKSGTMYAFTVRCVSSDSHSFTSGFDGVGKSIRYVEAPKITSVTNEKGNITITWDKPAGAEKYRVYYKTNTVGWTRLAELTSNSYTWTGWPGAPKGTLYRFTVRCVSSDGQTFTSGFDPQGKMLPNSEEQYYAAQVLDKVGWDLWEAFKWAAAMPYERFYDDPVPKGYTKCQWYSLYGFKNYRGNCHVMASTFYHMAILLGYDAHYVFGYVPRQRGGLGEHGWVEIDLDGTTYVCDPDFTLYTTTVEQGFMFKYKTPGTWMYQNYHREN